MPLRSPVRWLTATAALEALADSVSRTLLPIIAVSLLGAGTGLVGVLNSLGLAAFLLLGLPIGILADRRSTPHRTMTTSTLLRAGALALGVLVWLLGGLEGSAGIAVLLGIALLIGVADVGYTTGLGMLVPRLVPATEVRAVYGRTQTAAQAATSAGPALLAAALTMVNAPLAWALAVAGYLGSALTQRRLRPDGVASTPPPRTSPWAQVRRGTGVLRGQPLLRRITLATALSNSAVMCANTLLPVVALTQHGLPPATYATFGVVGALSGVLGASCASSITARAGLARTRVGCAGVMTLGALLVLGSGTLVDVLPGPVALWLGLQSALAGLAGAVALVAGADLVPRLAPRELLGTVLAAQRTVTLGVMPVTAVAVGVAGSVLGVAPTAVAWLVLAAASALPVLGLPEPPDLPTPPREPRPPR